ncbi:M56 family metallopeptidase [Paenibacillus sp. SAF-054]|uniref:M56 family metallopeptidase n=1 Tax=unclassified Paenibacillus TaxID=185978 RepID=UPI003F8167A7
MNIAESLFRWFVAATLTASMAGLVVMAVQRLLRRRMSARLRYALWLIVLVRLVMPVFPHSPVSLFHALPTYSDIKNAVSGIPFPQDKPATESFNSVKEISQPSYYTTNASERNSLHQQVMPQELGAGTALPAQETHPANLALSALWLAGTIAFLTYNGVYWLRLKRKQRSFRRVSDPAVTAVLAECMDLFHVKKPILLFTDATIPSPYIAGLMRPAVYMPESLGAAADTGPLKHIIAHELAHYKRKDMAWNMLGSLVLAVHWMNPMVWYMMRRMKSDREQACDACALEVLGEREAVPYGMTIIGFLRANSTGRNQPHLLYFKGMNGEKDITRRIRMISSFKKGSYKLSWLAVLLVLLLGTVTLTNAPVSKAGASAWVHAEEGGSERLFDDGGFLVYDNLEKGARVAPFVFKVPSVLPAGYAFDELSFHELPLTSSASPVVTINYLKARINNSSGSMHLKISRSAGLEEIYERIAADENKSLEGLGNKEGSYVIEKAPISLSGVEGVKITIRMLVWEGQPERYYYIWKDQGITYQLDSYGGVSPDDYERMILSMQLPDRELNKLYENNDYHGRTMTYLFDTEDVRRAQKLIGYNAVFPRELPGGFAASGSYVSRKVNFNYPENDQDSMRMLLEVSYHPVKKDKSKEEQVKGIKDVDYTQMLNGTMYEEMKKLGRVSFMRIDGERNNVKLKPVSIGGREALRTEKFKVDGPLSSPGETDLVSYFWLEDGVCFQARFTGQGPEEEQIVQYLMQQDKS